MTSTIRINPYHKRLVRATFWMVEPKADDAARVFYSKLFEISPELRPLFMGDMKHQGKVMIEMLATLIKGLNTLDVLAPLVRNMGKRHSHNGVKVEHYTAAATALLYSLQVELKENWNEEVEMAWMEVYDTIARLMLNGTNYES